MTKETATQRIKTAEQLDRMYLRLACQLIEPYETPDRLVLVGMQTRGVHIAKRLKQIIRDRYEHDLPLGVLDVTFYRDDFRTKLKMPEVKVTEIPFDLYEKDVVLVDDVLYTGRTVRSAMDAIMSFGRPRSIKFCALVDRGHRELPVNADYVGITIPTHEREEVRVRVEALDGEEAIDVVQLETSQQRSAQGQEDGDE
ncbi:MAG: bifunctional pyr operon transcriptional regulator/uracil phosphoribosyltransferase PyrR [Bacteroidota bacterium]